VVIQADGEKQAAKKISEATEILTRVNGAMTLRMLRTISESANQESNTILFPIPMELIHLLTKSTESPVKASDDINAEVKKAENTGAWEETWTADEEV